MRITFIIRNLTDETVAALLTMEARALHAKLAAWAFGDLKHCVSVKYGPSNDFRDRVAWNDVIKSEAPISAQIERRKGYRLVTFKS